MYSTVYFNQMKPTGVVQDEMFPDGDAGWMEMDEVTNHLLYLMSLYIRHIYSMHANRLFTPCTFVHSSFLLLFPFFSLLGCIRRWHAH